MKTVGFIGVGSIGRPMAECVERAGFGLLVCDAFPAALEGFKARGTATTGRPADCGTRDMVIVMVANDDQAREVLLGPNGLIHGIDPARPPMLALMSTVLPDTVKAMAAALGPKGVRVIDAPVSGGVVRAAEGALTIMAGGAEADLAAARPVLECMAKTITHCGPLSSGEAVKICNNILGVCNVFLMVETVQIAKRLGLDPARLAAVMETSSGRSSGTQNFAAYAKMIGANGATLRAAKANADVCRKDLAHAAKLGVSTGLAVPFIDAMLKTSLEVANEDFEARWREVAAMAE